MYIDLGKKYDKPLRKDYETKEDHNKARKAWFQTNKGKKYTSEVDAWVKDNTEPIDDWRDRKAAIERQLSEAVILKNDAENAGKTEAASMQDIRIEQLRRKKSRNLINNTPRGEWVRPKKF